MAGGPTVVELTSDVLAARTARALGRRWPGVRVRDVARLAGGSSSLTYSAECTSGPADRVVVKVAPAGLAPVRNRDVVRQARVLDALATQIELRVPIVYATDDGEPPQIPPLFVMEWVAGESIEPAMTPPDDTPPAATIDARLGHAAQMLRAMHATTPRELGLQNEPVVDLAGELARWARVIAASEAGPSVQGRADELYDRLAVGLPAPTPATLVHGDWRLGNMLSVDGEIRAVIDWEIWSVGDPRGDLAWFLAFCDRNHPWSINPTTSFLDAEQLAHLYSPAPIPEFGWFRALAHYKQAAQALLLTKNSRRRGERSPLWDVLSASVASLLDLAHDDLL
jgi:aminoglycoside phosphotransferase (APT) family kinase protein